MKDVRAPAILLLLLLLLLLRRHPRFIYLPGSECRRCHLPRRAYARSLANPGVRNSLRGERRLLLFTLEARDCLGVALRRRTIQLALQLKVHRLAGDGRVGALIQQLLDHLHTIKRSGEDQRRLLPCGFQRVHISAVFRKQGHGLGIAGRRRQV